MIRLPRASLVLVTGFFGTILLQLSFIHGQQYYGENGGIETVWARAGTNTSIPCLGAATGRVSRLQWWREDKMIAEWADGRRIQWEGNAHTSLASSNARFALVFSPVSYSDNGDYQCLVNNQLQPNSGVREGIVRLRVQDVPEPPGMPLIMGFTSRSVNLSWAPSVFNRNSPILHYIIHIRVGENGAWDTSNTIRTKDNTTNYELEALQPYTVYSFRVLAVNVIGTSAPSKESYYMVTLREVPSGKPTITSAQNVSSSSIRIQWAPPPKHTIHGEFLGYRLTYRTRGKNEAQREVFLSDATIGHYTIRSLSAFTDYTISVQVVNPAGRGPAAMINVMTDEGVPSHPLNLTYVKVTKNSVRLRWLEPEFPNGIIKAYYIYFLELAADKTDVRRTYEVRNVMNYTLDGLKPYTKYKIWVKAKTGKDEGAASSTITIETDVDGPSAPKIFNLTCQSTDSIFVQWQQPEIFYHKIDYYYVLYRAESSYGFEEIPMLAAEDRSDHAMFIPNLTSNLLYEVMVQGASHSIIQHSKIYKGAVSEPRKVILREKCTVNGNAGSSEKLTAGLIAGVVCASFALLLAIISFILWRKYFQAAYYYLDDPPGNRASPQLSETYDESEYTPVPSHLWSKHVSDLHADGDIGFSREYEAIQHVSDLDLSSEHSQLVENKSKNRYVNIVAYDHTRVVLKPISGQKKSPDYINANYIDGYCKSRAYIGTQGPLPSTFDDYWRMIWEQRVYIIVMITNLVERGRHDPSTSELDDTRKCDMYWPKEGAETYGIIQVKMVQELTMATYTLRTFVIRNVKLKKKQASERTIYQYHYTNWPDHGVPEHSLPVLSFVRKSAAANPPNGGPIIVHCSAGVGRTGTYIVLDAMLKQIAHRQSINVFGFLRHIRQQRNYLVQTEEQYIFIHDALLEAIESGDTEVERSQLGRYLQTLQHAESNDIALAENEKPVVAKSWSLLEKQFRLVSSFKAKDFNVVSALKPCNKSKNRTLNLIPIESHRVHITPKPGTDGSDYINATFLHGFNKLREFILTQHPVFETIADFWQMVWDHNSQTVVLLSPIIEKEFPQFWPDSGEESDYGTFKLKLSEEKLQGSFVTRDFILQSTQDDYELTCRLMQCAGWPESCSSPLSSVFDLVQLVQEWHLEYQNGPMIVIDRNGGTEAATFCCLTTLYKQLEYENSVDVYVCAKLYHIRRPGIWRSQDDYLFLYRALESIANNPYLCEKGGSVVGGGGVGGPGSGGNNADTSFCSSQGGMVTNGHVNSNGHAVLPSKGASESVA